MSVYLLATLDTKGREIAYVRDLLEKQGVGACVVDTGCMGEPAIPADVTREAVFKAAGTTLDAVRAKGDRGEAVTLAAQGAAAIVADHHGGARVTGILGIGGSAGTTIGTAAMRALPLGLPKIMVSTLASGDVAAFVGPRDIMMVNSVVDVAGINRISRAILGNAAHAMVGMIKFPIPLAGAEEKPIVVASMFGVTTPCVEKAREVLEAAGYEVLVFHATGAGGRAMESLVTDGLVAGVLDITTTELADEFVGGVLSAGPNRLKAAAVAGVPQVVSVGATDMVNFWAMDTVPEKFRSRNLYKHNASITLMRTTPDENKKIGQDIGRKLAAANGRAAIMLPLKGVSAIDKDGQPFDDPAARTTLFDAIRATHGKTELIELDHHINDEVFATAAANKLLDLMR